MSSFPSQFNAAQFKFNKWDLDTIKHQNPYLHHKITNIKPLKEFFNLSKLNTPKTINEAKTRLLFNLNFFNSNYLIIVLIISIFLLFQKPMLLISLIGLIGGFIVLNNYEFEQIRIGNVNIHLNKTYLYLGLIILTTPVIFYSSPISTLISLSSISGGIIITHGLLIDNLPETSFNESVV